MVEDEHECGEGGVVLGLGGQWSNSTPASGGPNVTYQLGMGGVVFGGPPIICNRGIMIGGAGSPQAGTHVPPPPPPDGETVIGTGGAVIGSYNQAFELPRGGLLVGGTDHPSRGISSTGGALVGGTGLTPGWGLFAGGGLAIGSDSDISAGRELIGAGGALLGGLGILGSGRAAGGGLEFGGTGSENIGTAPAIGAGGAVFGGVGLRPNQRLGSSGGVVFGTVPPLPPPPPGPVSAEQIGAGGVVFGGSLV